MQTLVAAYDAGGAEVLSSYVKNKAGDYVFFLNGPAVNIFQSKIGEISIVAIDDVISDVSEVLLSTGWATDFEYNTLKKAKEAGIRTIAFLDHWVNYEERFVRNAVKILPDEIWIGDSYAQAIAKKKFGSTVVIKYVENPYFIDIKEELSKIHKQADSGTILYVCEPIAEHALKRYGKENYWGYTEFDALTFFLDNIKSLNADVKKIIIRPHPSENLHKYDELLAHYKHGIRVCRDNSLFEQVASSDVIVGCQSMAMVVGLLLEKKVVSSIPLKKNQCALPFDSIIRMSDML